MIGCLHGKLISKQPPGLLIDVNGVGYEIYASMNTFYQLPEVGQEVMLYTHFVVREDAQTLYGFSDKQERSLFRELIKINGVGPRIALAILSSISTEDFICCIANNHVATLVRIPGIGRKTAERLVIEMRDKLEHWQRNAADLSPEKLKVTLDPSTRMIQDAVSALIALGYKPQEASRAVSQLASEGIEAEELIRQALRNIVKNRD